MAATPESPGAAKKEKPFPFFKLPRELRDTIYEYATTSVRLSRPALEFVDSSPSAIVHGACYVNLLGVSRVFKSEFS